MIRSLTLATTAVGCRLKRTAPKIPIAISSVSAVAGATQDLRPCEVSSTSAAGPDQARQSKAEGRKQRQIGRQAEHGEWQQPGEGRCIDQEGVADPVKSGHEIAETEPPAGRRR